LWSSGDRGPSRCIRRSAGRYIRSSKTENSPEKEVPCPKPEIKFEKSIEKRWRYVDREIDGFMHPYGFKRVKAHLSILTWRKFIAVRLYGTDHVVLRLKHLSSLLA
jgi:hypothetical protein